MRLELTDQDKIRILCTEDLFEILRHVLFREDKIGRGREHFWVLGLDHELRLLFLELVALGNRNQFVVKPNEVFQLAVHQLSTYVVLAHTHLGTILEPSAEDLDTTDRLMHAAELLSLEVIEHLILNETKYFSFKEKGLMEDLSKSKKYVAGYLEVDRLREKGEEKGKKEMAKTLKQKNVDLSVIAESSGLSIEEIKRL